MYVTDTPVMDRLTHPGMAELDMATEALETAMADLEGWIDESNPEEDQRPRYGVPASPAEVHKGLSGALSAASVAYHHARDALALALYPNP